MRTSWQVVFLIFFLISSISAFGQDKPLIGSLKRELKKQQTDTGKIRLLLAISHQYTTSDTVNALLYIEQAKNISKHIDCEKCNADILLEEGVLARRTSNYPISMDKFEKALSVYRQLRMKDKIARCCLWIGSIYGESLNNTKAMEYYSEAMEIFKLLNENAGISRCYFLMATIYASQDKNKLAIDYSKKAIQFANKKNKKLLAELNYNLFCYYQAEKEFQKALSLESSIFPVLKEVNNWHLLGRAYGSLGSLYFDMGNYKKAKEAAQQAIFYCSKYRNIESFMLAELCLAQIYTETNQLDSAIYKLNQLLDINNKQLKSINYEDKIYFRLYKAYEKKGDLKSAFVYCNKFLSVDDSIAQNLNSKKLLEIQTKYELDLKNEQIKLLSKEKQLAKQKVVTYGIGLIALIILVVCFSIYTYRRAADKKLIHEAKLKEAAYKIDLKNRELTHKAIHLSQQEQILSNIKEQLLDVDVENSGGKEAILGVLADIDAQLKQNSMEDFEKYFIEVHPEFLNLLKQEYPELTQAELKLCALLRLNLNSKDIASLTHKSIRSVESTRTIIRKKMGLTKENLFDIISTI